MSEITNRELEVLHMVAYEHSTREIADRLFISEHTVLSHRKSLRFKMKVKNTAGLVRRAFEEGLMSIGQIATILLLLQFSQTEVSAQNDFVTIWQSDNTGVTSDTEIGIPGIGTYSLSWEEVNNTSNNGVVGSITGAYILKLPSAGTYRISISNSIDAIHFNNSGDKQKIVEVTHWGKVSWTSFDRAFSGCSNLVISAQDQPKLSGVTTMRSAFANIKEISSDITDWDVSTVNDMRGLFNNLITFNQDIGDWDISNVTDMTNMLTSCGMLKRTYDNVLRGWEVQSVASNINLGANGLTYCNGTAARQRLKDDHSWSFTGDSELCSAFITTWDTEKSGTSCNSCITIPTVGSGYLYDIDFENNASIEINGVTGDYTYDFGTPGVYEVAIYGDFPRIYFNNDKDNEKLLSVDQWGDIEWSSMEDAFNGCFNLTLNAIDNPNLSNVTTLYAMFKACDSLDSDISTWDVSSVVNMSHMFAFTDLFDQDLSTWEVGNVVDMSSMFQAAAKFDSPLNWAEKTALVENMQFMFYAAREFDQDISDWDVSSVTNMLGMFGNGTIFNQDISDWDVSSVTDMSRMFSFSQDFNKPLNWNTKTANVNNMSEMFENATSFNQDISGWNVEAVTNMSRMFESTPVFNQDLSDWNVSSVKDMSEMFRNAYAFNSPLNWGATTSQVENLHEMFHNATAFNQDLSNWDVSAVTDMSKMFEGAITFNSPLDWGANTASVENLYWMFGSATAFNQDVSNWDVSNVTNMSSLFYDAQLFNSPLNWGDQTGQVTDMSYMFGYTESFNQDISGWDVSNVEDMHEMFYDAQAFNQNLGNWDISKVNNLDYFIDYSNLSTYNYDATLIGWESSGLHLDNVDFEVEELKFCSSGSARMRLINEHGWTIDDDGPVLGGNNDWTGNTPQNWNDAVSNWSTMLIPSQCDDIVLPTLSDITIQSGKSGYGGTLDIEAGAILEVESGAILEIHFVPQ